ncbi:MAG: SDR family oxidoreductase, partial [Planctomycetes bacterium]|nr:SDR family oxidoreductase [Planctomycetota bacterium]
ILVNNAGTNIRTPTLDTSDETWRTVLQTNLDSVFFMTRAAGAGMVERGSGSVIHIGSVAGVVGMPTGVAYGATKAAIGQMTRSLAQEWGPHGVRVNCIAPWYFHTPLTEKLLAAPDYLARILRATPLRRTGRDEDLVGVVVFLASEASAYVTGQTLAVDGGMSTSAFHPEA